MVTTPRPKSPAVGEPAIGTTKVFVSVNVMQLGPVRHGGSQGLWQHGSWVSGVTGVVPSVGSKTGVAGVDMGVLLWGVKPLGAIRCGNPTVFECGSINHFRKSQ